MGLNMVRVAIGLKGAEQGNGQQCSLEHQYTLGAEQGSGQQSSLDLRAILGTSFWLFLTSNENMPYIYIYIGCDT